MRRLITFRPKKSPKRTSSVGQFWDLRLNAETIATANGVDGRSRDIWIVTLPPSMKAPRRRRTRSPNTLVFLRHLPRAYLLSLFLAVLCAWTVCASHPPVDISSNDIFDPLPDIPDVLQQRDLSHDLVTRQSNESTQLQPNAITSKDISPATTDFWTFPTSQLNLTGSTTVYFTVSVCTQPFPRPGLNATQIYLNETLPPLQIHVSANSRPGPGSNSSVQPAELSLGYAAVNVSGVTGDLFLSVVAGNVSSDWQGSWSYEIGASTQGSPP
jgi:Stretch-activated Ca2+-permeable channel component